MDPQFHAEFLQRIGHTVEEHNGALWFDVFARAYTTTPCDTLINPQEFESSDVLGGKGIMARYSCPVDAGYPSFQQVVTDKTYGMSTLINKARNKTRQGLRNCTTSQIDPKELGDEGVALHAETLTRQGRKLPDNFESYWKNYFLEASNSPCATAWAAWHEGQLASYLISFKVGTTEYISIVRSRQDKLKFRPNNAMLFTFLEWAMARDEVAEVSIGLQSLQSGGQALDLFKRGMGFQERPIGQRIELRRGPLTAVPRPVVSLAAKTLNFLPGGEKTARLSGALQWYASQPEIRRAA